MQFWQALVNEICSPWGWLLILSTLSCVGFVGMALFQFIKCLLTKNTTSLSKQFIILLPITNTLLMIYDIVLFVLCYINGPELYGIAWSMLLPALINGLISAYGTMILKIKYSHQAKKHKMTELQYYEKYLKPKSFSYRRQKTKNKKNSHL